MQIYSTWKHRMDGERRNAFDKRNPAWRDPFDTTYKNGTCNTQFL